MLIAAIVYLYSGGGLNKSTHSTLTMVPEPVTLSLLTLGATALLRRKRFGWPRRSVP